MTVIVAIASSGKVVMGADSAASDREYIGASLSPKIRRVGDYLIGYCNSRGTGQVLHFLEYPKPKGDDLERFMRMEFMPVVKSAFEAMCVDVNDEEANSVTCLVGVKGRLFEIDSTDWSVTEWQEASVGSGYQYAFGVLHATKHVRSAAKRVALAVEAACRYSPTCMEPVEVHSL